jgi:hypothetical protein
VDGTVPNRLPFEALDDVRHAPQMRARFVQPFDCPLKLLGRDFAS